MNVQIIVYHTRTRELRRVLDPQMEVNDVYLIDALIKNANAQPDESTLVYEKRGDGQDNIHSWRDAIARARS